MLREKGQGFGMGNTQELIFYQKARQVVKAIDALMKIWPKTMQAQEISRQLFRSATSVGANIAEGHGRHTYKDQVHFCIQARDFLSGTSNHLIDAYDCNYITEEQLLMYKTKYHEVESLLNGYITYLRGRL